MSAIWSSLLDKEPFERLARLAVRLTGAPMTMVCVVRGGELRLVSWIGLPEPWGSRGEVPKPHPLCDHVFRTGEIDAIADTRGHPRLQPGSAGEVLGVAAYLGIPLRTRDGRVVGVFSVLDHRPREWTPEQVEAVQDVTLAAVTEVELLARTEELERAQARWRESEERLRDILESISDAFFALDAEWRFTYLNHAAREDAIRLLDREPGELIGQRLWDLRPDVEGTTFAREYRRVMEERTPAHFEAHYAPFDMWTEVHAYPGAGGGIAVYYRDITPRKRMEARLRESEARFRALTENTLDVVSILSPDGTATYHSPSVRRVLGYSPEELVGRNVFELIHPDDAARVAEVLGRAIAEPGSPHSVEFRLRHADGSWVVVESVGQSHLHDPAVGGIVANSRDVTHRRAVEQELRRSEQRFRTLSMAAPVGIFGADPEGRATFVNRRWEEISGVPAERSLGHRWSELVHPEDRVEVMERWLRQSRLGQEYRDTFRMVRPDGAIRWVDVHATALRSEDGALLGHIGTAEDVSERRAAEQALRESQERYRALAELSPEPTLVNADGRFVYANRAAARLLGGRDVQEVVGRPVFELIDPRCHGLVRERIRQVLEERREVQPVEALWRRLDGTPVQVEVAAGAIQWEGRPAIQVLVRDIAERKRAEQALRESERRFRLMIESVQDYAIILLDPEGRIVQWNAGAERVKGYREEEILGQHISVFYPEEDRASGKPLRMLQLAEREGHYEDEHWRVRKDGSRFWASVVITALRGESGRLEGFVKITRDLTERHAREELLRHQSEMVQLLQHVAVAANEAKSPEEAIRDTIQYVCTHAGFAAGHAFVRAGDDSDELVASSLWYLEDEARLAPFRQATEALRIRAGTGLAGRVLASGEIRWVGSQADAAAFPQVEVARQTGLRSAISCPVLVGEEVVAALEFFSEEEIQPDPALLETLANLGTQLGRVFERERAQADILRAKEEAERANRAKSEFLSRMSHELRTPLNAILGFGQLLELEVEREMDRESVAQILGAGRHLLSLIDEVLDLAKIEAERITLSMEPVPVAHVVAESVSLVGSLGAQRGVRVGYDEVPLSLHVRADQQRLKQVLLNLLSNAIKYNRNGGEVAVSCAATEAARLRIEVSDTGRGIAPDQLKRLFTPFDRLNAERSEVPGTGLGLALSKGLMEAMGGSIGVESTPGEGSTFWIELPLADSPGAPAGTRGGDELPADGPAGPAGHTVLYIEDNLSNLRLVERVLARRPGLTLVPAMQGSLGLELAREVRPDLILLDVHLPDMGGEEVLRRLQADAALREVPVVIVSADATPRQVERFVEAGARAYLTKPIEVRRFLEVLDETLGN